MKFSPKQNTIIKESVEYLRAGGGGYKIFKGYAGVGKSTCLKEVVKLIPDLTILVPTHMAKSVILNMLKGINDNPRVITVTSFLRDCKGTKEDKLAMQINSAEMAGKDVLVKKLKEAKERMIANGQSQDPVFLDKEIFDVEVHVWCDESSMITRDDKNAIVDKSESTVFAGDGFQLPPVVQHDMWYQDWFYRERHTWMLDQVFRNSGDVLSFATHIRNSKTSSKYDIMKHISDMKLKDVIRVKKSDKVRKKIVAEGIALLSYYNDDVDSCNFDVRKAMGYQPNTVLPHEKLYCANNFGNFNNKDIVGVKIAKNISTDKPFYATIVDIVRDTESDTIINPARMLIDKTQAERKLLLNVQGLVLRYDYARTVHGAQGSEWGKVLLTGRLPNIEPLQFNRYLYTAVTRAKTRFGILI